VRALTLVTLLLATMLSATAARATALATVDFGAEQPSSAARFAVESILASGGQARRCFAVVDKGDARVYVFDALGHLLGAAPVLLGQQVGDATVPGVGDKRPEDVLPSERTTPAGRFVTEPGRNLDEEDVVWVDYGASFAIHRVRAGTSYAARMARLQTRSPAAHRVSFGCVVVDGEFFDRVIWPAFGHGAGIVYVLPETRPVASLFPRAPLEIAGTVKTSLSR